MTAKQRTIERVLTRVFRLGITLNGLTFKAIREIVEGRGIVVIVRNLSCKVCGQKHKIGWVLAHKPEKPLTKLFPRKK